MADFLDGAGFAVPDFLATDFFTAVCFALDVFFTAFVVFDALTLFFAFGALDAFTDFAAFAFEAFVFCAGDALATRTPAFFRPARRTTLARGTANVNSEGRTLARFADAGESDALTSASSRRSFTCECVCPLVFAAGFSLFVDTLAMARLFSFGMGVGMGVG